MKTEEAEKILKFIADSLIESKDFALGQAPDLIQQLVLWRRVESVVLVGIFLIIGLVFAIFSKRLYSKSKGLSEEKEHAVEYSDKDVAEIFSVISGILSIISLIVMIVMLISSLQIWIAPKIYVLNYCVDMLK